jgi:hypothetical protein
MLIDQAPKTTIQTGGRRQGRAWAAAQQAKAALASGKRVVMQSEGEFVEVVGVVDDPNTRLLEHRPSPE